MPDGESGLARNTLAICTRSSDLTDDFDRHTCLLLLALQSIEISVTKKLTSAPIRGISGGSQRELRVLHIGGGSEAGHAVTSSWGGTVSHQMAVFLDKLNPDFSDWEKHDKYKAAFEKLIRASFCSRTSRAFFERWVMPQECSATQPFARWGSLSAHDLKAEKQ